MNLEKPDFSACTAVIHMSISLAYACREQKSHGGKSLSLVVDNVSDQPLQSFFCAFIIFRGGSVVRNLLILWIALSMLSEFALADGLQAVRARVASRLMQAQRVGAVSYLLQTLAAGNDANLHALLVVLANEAGKDMPDQKPTRRSADSPDDPNSGQPAWDKQRRGGDSRYSDRGSGNARRWNQPERSARRRDE